MGYDRSRDDWIRSARVDLWDLPAAGAFRLMVLVTRAFGRSCPYCGSPGIFSSFCTLKERCPRCGVPFEREEGYFLGAYAVNLIGAEFAGFAFVLALLIRTDLSTLSLQVIAVVVAVGLPLLGYPYARSLWMAIDLMVHRPERHLSG